MMKMTKSHQALTCLQGHHGAVTSVAFAPDGQCLISGGDDGTLRVWDRTTQRELLGLLAHATTIYGIVALPTANWIASACQAGDVVVWNLATGQALARFDQGLATRSRALACSPDGRYLLIGNDDGVLWRWDWQADSALCLLGHARPVIGVALAADGELAVSLAHDATLCLWQLSRGVLLKTMVLDSNYGEPLGLSLALTADGRMAATSSSAVGVDLWELASGQRIATLDRMVGDVWALAFLPDNQHLLTASSVEGLETDGSAAMGNETKIRLWAIATGKEVAQFVGHRGIVHSLALSPNGRHFVSGSSDKTIRVWVYDQGT
jgi:WD40 repeat protein